jgi:hypothetical protein
MSKRFDLSPPESHQRKVPFLIFLIVVLKNSVPFEFTPILVGVAGGSAAGKTTLCEGIA